MRVLIVLMIAFTFGACSAPEKPTFKKLANIQFNSLSIRKPYSVKLNADAIFHNPNALGAEVTSMDFDVFVNGIKSTHITQDVSVRANAQSDFTLPIVSTIPLKDIFEDFKLKDILKSKTIQYQMVGHLELELGGVSVDVPFTYEGEEELGL